MQECATVPANPFPEPTNGKAVALWKNVKNVAVPEASHSLDTNGGIDNPDVGGSGIGGWGSPAMAGVAQAAIAAGLTARRKSKKAPEGLSLDDVDGENLPPTCGDGDNDDRKGGGSGSTSSSCGNGQGSEERCPSPGTTTSTVGGTQQGGGGGDSSPQMMRQESYYLRGAIEADRDKNFLKTIADCIPGMVQQYVTWQHFNSKPLRYCSPLMLLLLQVSHLVLLLLRVVDVTLREGSRTGLQTFSFVAMNTNSLYLGIMNLLQQ